MDGRQWQSSKLEESYKKGVDTMLYLVKLFVQGLFFYALQDLFSWCWARRESFSRWTYKYEFEIDIRVWAVYLGKIRFMRFDNPLLDYYQYSIAKNGNPPFWGILAHSYSVRDWNTGRKVYYDNFIDPKLEVLMGWILRGYLWLHDQNWAQTLFPSFMVGKYVPGGLWAAYCAYSEDHKERVVTVNRLPDGTLPLDEVLSYMVLKGMLIEEPGGTAPTLKWDDVITADNDIIEERCNGLVEWMGWNAATFWNPALRGKPFGQKWMPSDRTKDHLRATGFPEELI
jgi:hypothetical protein